MNKHSRNTNDVLPSKIKTKDETPDQIVEKTHNSILENRNNSGVLRQADRVIEGENANEQEESEVSGENSEKDPYISTKDAEESQVSAEEDEQGDSENKAIGDDNDDFDIHYIDLDDQLSQLEESEIGDFPTEAEESPEDFDIEDDEEIEDDEIEDDLDDEAISETDEQLRKHRRRKKAGFIVLGIIAFLAIVYLIISWFFSNHFYFSTKINGNDFGLKSVSEVEAYLGEQVSGYELTLKEIDGQSEIIKGSDINISYKKSDEIQKLLKKQNPFLWPAALWDKHSEQTEIGVEYDEAKLAEVIKGLNCIVSKEQIASVSAKPVFDGKAFVVEPEVIGTQVNAEVFNQKVAEYIKGFVSELPMDEEECYLKPPFVSDSPEVLEAVNNLNQYLKATITYEVSPQTEVLDQTVIAGWVSADANMKVQFNTDAVWEYVAGLSAKYNTVGSTRTFTTATGNVVEVEGGNFGWWIDEQAEYDTIIQNIQAGEPVSRQPQYSSWGAANGTDNDYGNTYAEVDLTTQYMWFIQDGAVVMESDIVTGEPSAGDATPQGSYHLTYKTQNAVLRGERYPDGTYEYESPVAYWMPFNGGIGFHDASWQAAFGGNRYLTYGSHGCINLPYDKAEALYGLLQDNTPIVLHY